MYPPKTYLLVLCGGVQRNNYFGSPLLKLAVSFDFDYIYIYIYTHVFFIPGGLLVGNVVVKYIQEHQHATFMIRNFLESFRYASSIAFVMS